MMTRLGILLCAALTVMAQKPLVEGNPSSSVRVLIYEDLQCPDCADFRKMLDKELLPKFEKTVAFEHRDFPLPKHEWARKAALAARYFETVSPQLAVEFRKTTMAKQASITPETFDTHLSDFAKANKSDPAKALAALNDPALTARLETEYQTAIARGIARTPTVLVNGEPFIEQFPSADIIKHIQQELSAAK